MIAVQQDLELADARRARDLKRVSSSMHNSSPEEILAYAVSNYPTLTMATAFGAEGCALISMLAGIPGGRSVRIFNLETGYQFAETLETRDRIAYRYGIEVELVRPAESVIEMETRFGGPIYGSNPDECCRIRKIEPLKKALSGHEAWLTAIRRDQTRDRSIAEVVEWDARFNLIKVNPLAHWSREDVWTYIKVNEVSLQQAARCRVSEHRLPWAMHPSRCAAGEGDRAGPLAVHCKAGVRAAHKDGLSCDREQAHLRFPSPYPLPTARSSSTAASSLALDAAETTGEGQCAYGINCLANSDSYPL